MATRAAQTVTAKRGFVVLVGLSLALLAVRFYAAGRLGFGDSEALYACYAMHPQAAYLDHPGLIGVLARALGTRGAAPTPHAAHLATALLATLVPWLVAVSARGAGATWKAAFAAAAAVLVIPEIAVGLFAMTPDLLLAIGWLGALGLAAAGLRAAPTSARAAVFLVGAGLAAGIATAAKVSGLALLLAMAATYATRAARPHAKTIWPWAGLVAGLLVVVPIALFEAKSGWPMLQHRLIDTQEEAGLSLRNLALLPLGQLAYLSPLVVVVAVLIARDLWRTRAADAVSVLLALAVFVPLAILVPLCLWSRVAEPHWIAPALLALPLHWTRGTRGAPDKPIVPRRLAVATWATAMTCVVAIHAWVLVPALVRVVPESWYDARFDLANELYGWPEAVLGVKRALVEEEGPGFTRGEVVVVGPHWTVCAQLHAALGEAVPVGCAAPVRDDFDDWYPREAWIQAETLVFVTDNRFDVDPASLSRHHATTRTSKVTVMRGGRVARVFVITVLSRRGAS